MSETAVLQERHQLEDVPEVPHEEDSEKPQIKGSWAPIIKHLGEIAQQEAANQVESQVINDTEGLADEKTVQEEGPEGWIVRKKYKKGVLIGLGAVSVTVAALAGHQYLYKRRRK